MKMPSSTSHTFSQVPRAEIPRSQFDRSSGYKTTFDAGWLVPFYVDEALPGDTFNLSMTAFARLATPLKPVMDNMKMDTFFFFVPIRLIWDNWQKFNGEQVDPGDSTDFVIPQMVSTAVTGYLAGSIHDYFGLPTEVPGLSHSTLWHRAYNLVYNEWFRDQNLQDSVVVDRDDGPDLPADYVLLRRGKRHDYFTSALPFPQKGPSVEIPLGAQAPVVGIGSQNQTWNTGPVNAYETGGTGAVAYASYRQTAINDANNAMYVEQDPNNAGFPGIYADLSTATAATINSLRQAFQMQKFFERDARGGTRYTEIIRSHFGVVSPDARLQRPEYLGGGTTDVTVSPIPQTSAATDPLDTTPQGNLAGIGTASLVNNGFSKSFTEHGVLIGLVCVRADMTYQQGLNRMWSRSTREDFYWPTFSHLGEQSVLNKEIYAQGSVAPTVDAAVFGYQERYAEYRYKPSQITGEFRSNFAQSLDFWHLAQDFAALPVLNDEFIVEDPPIDRIIAVPSEPHFLFDSFIKLKCARPMPVYSVPGLIDHF